MQNTFRKSLLFYNSPTALLIPGCPSFENKKQFGQKVSITCIESQNWMVWSASFMILNIAAPISQSHFDLPY